MTSFAALIQLWTGDLQTKCHSMVHYLSDMSKYGRFRSLFPGDMQAVP